MHSLSTVREHLVERLQTNVWKQVLRIIWKQNRSNAKNKNMLNSLAAVIHKGNVIRPAKEERLCTPALMNNFFLIFKVKLFIV